MFQITLVLLQKYCVTLQPLELIADCDAQDFANSSIAAIIDDDQSTFRTNGWMNFSAESNPKLPPRKQMYALGYAEGVLYQHHLFNHYANVKKYFLQHYLPYPDYPVELQIFFRDNLAWTREQAVRHTHDRYWKQVAATLAHFDGLVMGYQQTSNEEEFKTELDLFIYMSSGDLLDVVNFALPELRLNWTNPQIEDKYSTLNDHCSGLVKIVNKTSVFLSQVAWFTYGTMTRVAKQYKHNLTGIVQTMKFSSYPGFSYSFDDWYIVDSGFMFFETTGNVFNNTLYELCTPFSVMTWIRAPIAGRLGRNAQDFAQIIRKYNSGTYNNQWVVFDAAAFGKLEDDYDPATVHDLLWVVEQIPGRSGAYDATFRLFNESYYPSYNIHYLKELRIACGYPDLEESNTSKSYNESPRSKIFKTRNINVVDTESMKFMMRYNDYRNDPDAIYFVDGVEQRDPGNAISSRYDMREPSRALCFGAFDVKIGAYHKNNNTFMTHFISGPVWHDETYDDMPEKYIKPWNFADHPEFDCPKLGLMDGPYKYQWVDEAFPVNFSNDPEQQK